MPKGGVPDAHESISCWSGWNYFIDGIFWGDDEEGVILYLRPKGVSPDNITKALAAVAQAGRYLIQQEAITSLSPGAMPHATQTAARMTGGRPCIGAPLHADDTTLRHHTLMVEEHCHGEYPHPQ